jgi:N-methylhydantoinase B
MDIMKGTVFQHTHPGGGGWGDPIERDPAKVLSDVRNEYISAARAEADYGVVIDTTTWTIDTAATKARQAAIRQQRGWTEVPKVQRHDPIPRTPAATAKAAE